MRTYTLKVAGGQRKPSARRWLKQYLETHGPTLAGDVLEAATAEGYKIETMQQARMRSSQITYCKRGFPARVWWQLR